jgi:hypothetical protein
MSETKSRDKTAAPQTATVMQPSALSRIARRTRRQSHGPITRLMSPSDFGRLLKPFVFLDLIDNQGKPFSGFGLPIHIPASQPLHTLRRAASDMKTQTERRACCPPAVSNG